MHTVTFVGFVDDETKQKIDELLREKGIIKSEKFPSNLENTFVAEQLKFESIRNLSGFKLEVLKQRIEQGCVDYRTISIPQASVLTKYIEEFQYKTAFKGTL